MQFQSPRFGPIWLPVPDSPMCINSKLSGLRYPQHSESSRMPSGLFPIYQTTDSNYLISTNHLPYV